MTTVEARGLLEMASSFDVDDIEKAYKSQLIAHHPDRFPNDPAKMSWANEHLKQCAVAKDHLMAIVINGEDDLSHEEPSPTADGPSGYVMIRVQNQGSHKAWVARLVGRHPKYKFNREWVEVDHWFSRDDKQYKLRAGNIYEVNNPVKNERYFVLVRDQGVADRITLMDVYRYITF